MRRVQINAARMSFRASPSESTAVAYMTIAYKQYERKQITGEELLAVLEECKKRMPGSVAAACPLIPNK